jgi:HK97 family phage portal protein
MGLWDRWRRRRRIRPVERSNDSDAVFSLFAGAGLAGRKSTHELMLAYRRQPWLRAVVGRIGSELATAFKPELYTARPKDPARRQLFEHPLLDLLENPCPEWMPAHVVWKVTENALDLDGNAYLVVDRNALVMPVRLTPVAPQHVRETPTPKSPFFRISVDGREVKLEARDVLWIRDPDPANPWGKGTGIGEACADESDTDEYAARAVKAFFSNGMLPDSVIGFEGANEDEAKRAQAVFESKFRGPGNRNRTFFTNKKLTSQRLDTSFKDQQLIEVRK